MARVRGPHQKFRTGSSSSDPTVRHPRTKRQRRPKAVKLLGEKSQRSPTPTRVRAASLRMRNPFPWMPLPEALVKLELDRLGLVYSHRYFDPAWSPLMTAVFGQQPYAPEFTLPYDKVAIAVMRSTFGGQVAPLLDRVALADVVLKREGWRFVMWWDTDITTHLIGLFQKDLPQLLGGKGHHGKYIIPPYGEIDFLAKLRQSLLHRKTLSKTAHFSTRQGERVGRRQYRRRKRRHL